MEFGQTQYALLSVIIILWSSLSDSVCHSQYTDYYSEGF